MAREDRTTPKGADAGVEIPDMFAWMMQEQLRERAKELARIGRKNVAGAEISAAAAMPESRERE